MAAHSDMVVNRENIAMFTFCKFVVLLHMTSMEFILLRLSFVQWFFN